jgi:hypothetical protein|tara:strand:- start:463 stop:651 length:189 start_codon:yes stop_codon:yes gene_type:complete
MRKNIFKTPTKVASKAKTKTVVKPVVEPKVKAETKNFGGKPWSELSAIEKRMIEMYGTKYQK